MQISVARPMQRVSHLTYQVPGVIVKKTVCWEFELDKYYTTGETSENSGVGEQFYWQDRISRRRIAATMGALVCKPCSRMVFFARMTAKTNLSATETNTMDDIEELEQIPEDIPLELEEVTEFEEPLPTARNGLEVIKYEKPVCAPEPADEDLEELQEELDELLEPGESDSLT